MAAWMDVPTAGNSAESWDSQSVVPWAASRAGSSGKKLVASMAAKWVVD